MNQFTDSNPPRTLHLIQTKSINSFPQRNKENTMSNSGIIDDS